MPSQHHGAIKNQYRPQRRKGKILLGELNIICPNGTCWSQMHKMILSSSFHRHTVRARAFKIVQIFSVNRDQRF